jgi:hypothetical protein
MCTHKNNLLYTEQLIVTFNNLYMNDEQLSYICEQVI